VAADNLLGVTALFSVMKYKVQYRRESIIEHLILSQPKESRQV